MNEKQREILVIAQEECAEVIQEISKIFRFGIDKDGVTHQEKLEQEVGDVLCMINLLTAHGLVRPDVVTQAVKNKANKLKQWSKIYD
jgi:NTP pyrophosphatase (non-canonical NTP hydrolase)